MKSIKVGVIGLGCRGFGLLDPIMACEEAEIVAVCDLYDDRIERAQDYVFKKRGNVPVGYREYRELVADKRVQAVVIASSWDEHSRMAVHCMKQGKTVALEVAGAYDLEDCWDLVRVYEETKTPFMFLENCCFDRFELLASSLARAGVLGKVVYCHGAYGHDLRGEIAGGRVNRHYRLENYRWRNCENYPTHELGPICKLLGVNRGNRLVSLTSVATKGVAMEEYVNGDSCPDPSLKGAKFAQGDIVVTTISCANGEAITLRLDTTLPRYYAREFTVRGTKGLCLQDTDTVLLEEDIEENYDTPTVVRAISGSAEKYERFLPAVWRNITQEQKTLGHGGMDYLQFRGFFDAILQNKEMPIDVYDAALWMSITPLSERSIAQGGMPQPIPDFTRGKWHLRPIKDVVDLPYDEARQ